MKNFQLIVIAVLISINCFAQAPNWVWAKSAGGTNDDAGIHVSTDASGNVFMAGYFTSPSITFGTTTLTNAGGTGDIFIVKYDASGNVLWANSAGGASDDIGFGVSSDASGNVFMTGSFTSPSITFGTTTLTNAGSSDIFIVKYDASGNVLWANSAGGTDNDRGNSVSTDVTGNVFMTGFFYSPSIIFGTTALTNAGIVNTIIVKYDSSGNVLWANSAAGNSYDYGQSVSTDAIGNVFMTGLFSSPTITFGTITLTNVDNSGNTDDIFIVKYDASGNVLWANSAGGTDDDRGISVSTDLTGNVFMTGYFYSSSIIFGTTTLTNAGIVNTIIVKYDSSGNVLWAKSTGGTSYDFGNSVSTDATGNAFMTGSFSSPTIAFGATTLTNADNTGDHSDIFLAKLGVTTGIDEFAGGDKSNISPNPFSSQTTITFNEEQKNTTIKIMDVAGREMQNAALKMQNGRSVTIDMSGYAKGVYFVRIEDEQKNVKNRKIVLQ